MRATMRVFLSAASLALSSAGEHALRGWSQMRTVPAQNGHNKTLHAGHDGWVFTIALESAPTLCLDVVGGADDDGTLVQAWECNGHQSQLWFFDADAYQIQWAGDSSKCIDAGSDFSQGNQLMLWECNGEDQQKWSFDGTIFLAIDNPMCMDLYGGSTDSGTPVVLWDCAGLWSQTWIVSSGITIRTQSNYQVCVDLAGGSSDNGTPIQLWECNGMQKWIFEDGQIKLAADTSKCIDAGGLDAGNALMLWDCNGQNQQMWGYADDGTIYMSMNSADASLCVDLPGGSLDWGTQLQVFECNQCWNQLFDVEFPSSGKGLQQPQRPLASSKHNLTVGEDCPPMPAPSPSPSPPTPPTPTPSTGSHCIEGTQADQHGWPVFEDQASLQASNWAGYFQEVYGEIPQTGYPICVYNFNWLYKDVKENNGCDEHGMKPKWCPHSEGDYYKFNNEFDYFIGNSAFIYHKPPYNSIAENTWAEVTHAESWTGHLEGHGIWFFATEGSGVWYWIGNTAVYDDHWQAGLDLCGHPVSPTKIDGANVCGMDKGYNSIQYTKRRDPEWLPCSLTMAPRGIEIVGLIGYNGERLKGSKPCGNDSGQGVFKAGWEASQDCDCDNSLNRANCKLGPGFPPNYKH